jgi:dehydrogenase/reductase SDR family protein 4
MSKRFEGKVCLVTASSTGIGLAISEQFAKEGATVIISSRDKKHIDAAVEKIRNSGGKAEGYACHAGKIEDLEKMIEYIKGKYNRLDVLVPNAAVSTHFGPVLEMTPQ